MEYDLVFVCNFVSKIKINRGIAMKKFRKILAITLVMIMVLSLLTACKSDDGGKGNGDTNGNGSEANGDKKKRIALLCDEAGTQVFVLSMIDGLKDSAKKYDFEPIIMETADIAAYEDNARALIEEGVDMIIGGGWLPGEALAKIAEEFPDRADYALIDDNINVENVKSISYREQESAYLVGLMAGLITEEGDNVFGSVHVNEGAGSWKWRYGYMEGVKVTKPDAKFIFNYVGDYNEPAKAKEFAIQQYEQGARFINAAAAGGDKGVFEAALEKHFYTSGQDVDLTTPDNPYVVSSQIKDTYATVEYLMDQYFGGNWTTDDEVWGVEQGTIGAVHVTHESKNPMIDKLTEEHLAILKQAAEDIRTGKLDLANMPSEENYK